MQEGPTQTARRFVKRNFTWGNFLANWNLYYIGDLIHKYPSKTIPITITAVIAINKPHFLFLNATISMMKNAKYASSNIFVNPIFFLLSKFRFVEDFFVYPWEGDPS